MSYLKLYFCVGCRQVHYDTDYCEENGDLIIHDVKQFLRSVERLKDELALKRGGKN